MARLDQSITKLGELATRLNRASDQVNAIIARTEARLLETGIGLEVWLDEKFDERTLRDSRYGTSVGQIGWAKVEGQWCLAARRVQDVDRIDGELGGIVNVVEETIRSPLSGVSRAARIRAVKLLDQVVDRLVEEAESHLELIERLHAQDLESE